MKTKFTWLLLPLITLFITGNLLAQTPVGGSSPLQKVHVTKNTWPGHTQYDNYPGCGNDPNCTDRHDTTSVSGSLCSTMPDTYGITTITYCPGSQSEPQSIKFVMWKYQMINGDCKKITTTTVYLYECSGSSEKREIEEINHVSLSANTDILAYPNPASTSMMLNPESDIYLESITLINMMGQKVKVLNLNTMVYHNGNNSIDIADVPNGIYSVVAKTKEEFKTFSITINR